MQFLFDILPVVLFFGAFKWAESDPTAAVNLLQKFMGEGVAAASAPVLIATVVAVAASILQVAYLKIKGEKIKPMMIFSTAVIIIFGGLTLLLKNEMFIKWKPSILYFAFAAVLMFGRIRGRNYMKTVLNAAQIDIPAAAWERILFGTTAFLTAVALLNLFIAYTFSTEAWVDFKLFGIFGLTIFYTVCLTIYLAVKMPREEKEKGEPLDLSSKKD